MLAIYSIYLLFLSAVIVAVVATQAVRGTVELFSMRNFFALGFLMFQTVSAVWSLVTDEWGDDVWVDAPIGAGLIFCLMCTIFVMLFHWAYNAGWFVKKAAHRLNPTFPVPTTSSLLAVAMVLLVLAIICRYLLAYIPLIGILGNIFSVGLMPAVAAVVVWAWAPQMLNPAVTVIAMPLLLLTLFMSVYQTFGRRDLVSVLSACMWGAYHGLWKHMGLAFTVKRLAVLGAAGVVLVAAYTGAREKTTTETTASELVEKIGQTDLWYGIFSMASGQIAGGISIYLIETRPSVYAFDPFHSAIYFITMPVPRAIWEGKPEGLGLSIVKQAGVRRKAAEYNVGPGLMGHIWNDNPFLTMVPYAVFLGLMMRFLDEITRRHGLNPFLVVPCGVVIGEVIAMSRGELGLFLFRTTFATVAAFAGMIIAAKLLRSVGWPMAEPDAASEHAHAGDGADDGYSTPPEQAPGEYGEYPVEGAYGEQRPGG